MKLLVLLRLSARSVGRNLRRSFLTASAMAVGLAMLVFFRAIAEGGHEQWIDSAVRLATGHVAIQAPGFLETGRLAHRLDSLQVAAALEAVASPDIRATVVAWTPRLTVTGLASSAASALPARIEGVDPAREHDFSRIAERLVTGRYLKPGDRLRAVVGVELARRLELKVGSRFVLTAQSATGDVEGQLVRVAGIFKTGIQEMDERLIHIPLGTARRWLQTPGDVTTLAILVTSSHDTDRVVRRLRARLGRERGIRIVGWRRASPEMASAVRIDDWGDYVFHIILFVIITLAILNAVMMAVLGRRREFGILQAMGLTGAETGWLVFGEGLFLTAFSGVAGMLLGFAFTWGFFRHGLDFSAFMQNSMTASGGIINPVITPVFHLSQIGLSVGSILVIGTLASIYPALRASHMDVAEAMKFEP